MKRLLLVVIVAAVLTAALSVCCFAADNEPYILGDADGNGEVDVVDAVKVLRITIFIDRDPDGSVERRADVNGDGLDTVDATFIQRHATRIKTPYPIGEWVYPEQPTEQVTEPVTEQPTQAPTQKPTRDSDELPFVPSN